MPLSHYACTNCGFWQQYFAVPPDCPVCTDVRNDLPADGWDFRSEAEIAANHDGTAREVAPGLWAFTTTPSLGLNGTGWLTMSPAHIPLYPGAARCKPQYADAESRQRRSGPF